MRDAISHYPTEQAKKRGRPTKYRKWMCERVIELMRDGASLNEVAADLSIWKENMLDWERDHESFRHALQRGRVLSEAWWERKGREDLNAERFHSATYGLHMANRFGWRQKTDNVVTAVVTAAQAMSREEIIATLTELRALESKLAALESRTPGGNGETKAGVLLPAP